MRWSDVFGGVKRWWTRIRQSGSIERTRELTDAGAWAAQAVEGIRNEKGRVREEFAETEAGWFAGRPADATRAPREVYYHALAALYCGRAGWCVTLLEAVFAGGLSILLLALPWYWATAVGVTVTVLLAFGLKGVIAPLVVGRYADRPKAGRDLVLMLLVAVSPPALALLAVVFVVRGVAAEWAASWAFPLATAGLATLCPIIAGALFVLAGLYGWSTRLTEQYQRLEEAERQIIELRDHCSRALMVVVLGVFLAAANACTSAVAAQPSWAKSELTQTDGVGELWLDDTKSVDERDRTAVARVVLDTLSRVSPRIGVRVWFIFRFGDEPWRETPAERLEIPEWRAPKCDAPTEAGQVFRVQREIQAQTCEQRTSVAMQLHRQQLEKRLEQLGDGLVQRRPKPAPCTSLGDLLVRIAQTTKRRIIVVVSDGAETCRPGGLPRVAAPSAQTSVLFVLVGSAPASRSKNGTLSEQFASRRDALLGAAPWLRVLAPWEVTEELVPSQNR